jgi:hypothetical protein
MPGAGRTHGPPATKKQAAVTTTGSKIEFSAPRFFAMTIRRRRPASKIGT